MNWADLLKELLAGKAPRWCGYIIALCGFGIFVLWLPFVHLPPGEIEGMGHGLAICAAGIAIVGFAAKGKINSDNWVQTQAAKIIADKSVDTEQAKLLSPLPVARAISNLQRATGETKT